jgi:hypothetical protein
VHETPPFPLPPFSEAQMKSVTRARAASAR